MITHENGVYALHGDGFTCLLEVDRFGLPRLIHFGAPVSGADAAALTPHAATGWGASVLLDEGDLTSCADSAALAWSGCGLGDYRESPLELENGDGPMAPAFRLTDSRITDGTVPMAGGLPQAKGCGESLTLVFEGDGVRLTLYFTVMGGVLLRRTAVENMGKAPLWIRKAMSFCADLPGRFDMTTFDGGWIAEARRHITPVGEARVVNESVTGFSSHRHNPGFLLSAPGAGEDHGAVYGFNLVWSGNHYSSAQRSLQGLTRVMGGVSPANFRYELAPGGIFESPEAVLAWSDRGFNGLSRIMHGFVNSHIVPAPWQFKPRPVLYNDWEGCMFDFTEKKLLSLARKAAHLGCELFVLDDGWFGKRDSDTAGLGDYHVNRKKLPNGLNGLAKKINRMGMEFGLWFEPEAVNPDSDLYRRRPDWALVCGQPLTGRHELLLDLTRADVRDYIVDSVSAVLDSAPITYVKWDMNRHSPALGSKAYDYVLGLYEVLDRIFTPRPQILLESCASGGNRFDLGMMCFSPQIWCSDDTDPIERLDIQGGLSCLYPQSVMGSHVSAAPHAQTLRATPLTTRGNVSFFGLLGYELDLAHLVPVEEKEIRAQIAFYKQHRRTFQFGEFTRLSVEGAVGWQVRDGDTCLAGVFHRLIPAAPGYQYLAVQGLDPDRTYRVTARTQAVRVGQFGSLLKHVLPIDLDPNGAVLRTADRHYTMTDGGQSITATGRALMSGWPMPPRFMGAGYDPTLRVQGDFGSILYEIKEDLP